VGGLYAFLGEARPESLGEGGAVEVFADEDEGVLTRGSAQGLIAHRRYAQAGDSS